MQISVIKRGIFSYQLKKKKKLNISIHKIADTKHIFKRNR